MVLRGNKGWLGLDLGAQTITLAQAEGLTAHAEALRRRTASEDETI